MARTEREEQPVRDPLTQTMNASQMRREWSRTLRKVFSEHTRVIVEKSGIPVAAVISPADLERLERFEREWEVDRKVLQESWTAFEDVPAEELEREVTKALAEVREELRAERRRAATAAPDTA
jgi:prevent-host-death family protein